MSAGVKRLAMVVGSFGALSHVIFMMVVTNVFTDMDQTLSVWTSAVLITAAGFLIPFGLVHGVAWVIRGFKRHRENQKQGPSNQPMQPTPR